MNLSTSFALRFVLAQYWVISLLAQTASTASCSPEGPWQGPNQQRAQLSIAGNQAVWRASHTWTGQFDPGSGSLVLFRKPTADEMSTTLPDWAREQTAANAVWRLNLSLGSTPNQNTPFIRVLTLSGAWYASKVSYQQSKTKDGDIVSRKAWISGDELVRRVTYAKYCLAVPNPKLVDLMLDSLWDDYASGRARDRLVAYLKGVLDGVGQGAYDSTVGLVKSLYEAAEGWRNMTPDQLAQVPQGMRLAFDELKKGIRAFVDSASPNPESFANSLGRGVGNASVQVCVAEAAKRIDLGELERVLTNETGSVKLGPGKPNIWTKGDSTSVRNAYEHWIDHGTEFPELQNASQYVEKAHQFIDTPPSGTLTKVRPNGDKVLYNPQLDIFAVSDSNGVPRTMFKPDPAKHGFRSNLDYFNAQ